MFLILLNKILKTLVILVLPFFVLIRGAVFLHESYSLLPWVSIIGGIFGSAAILFLYFNVIYGRLTGRLGSLQVLKRSFLVAILLVLLYSLPGLLYLSGNNAKHADVRREFSSLHPILRLGVSTIVFLDRDLIITDAKRFPEDYRRMGLKTKKQSLHYRQSSGYVHAMDIRVNGRGEIRNQLLRLYFRAMGFNTLRHVGTDDHLHISLLSHDRPGAL